MYCLNGHHCINENKNTTNERLSTLRLVCDKHVPKRKSEKEQRRHTSKTEPEKSTPCFKSTIFFIELDLSGRHTHGPFLERKFGGTTPLRKCPKCPVCHRRESAVFPVVQFSSNAPCKAFTPENNVPPLAILV